jgi:hypothetical protein
MILDDAVLAVTWSLLAVAAVAVGGRFERITLKFHGSVYVCAAAAAAGLLACAFDGLLADPTTAWHPINLIGGAVALVAAACYGILIATAGQKVFEWPDLLPQAIIGVVVVLSVAGMGAPQLAELLATTSSGASGPAFLAASRTGVISLLAVALAFGGRRRSVRELSWLVYPLLVGGGAKLLWEDFQYGQPVALFLALGMYGGALIVTPGLMRRQA